MTTAHRRRPGRRLLVLGTAMASAVLLAACGGGGGGGGPVKDPDKLTYLYNVENGNIAPVLESLAEDECAAQNAALPLDISSIPQGELDAQIQLLAGQDALPVMFAAGGTPAEGVKLWKAGKLVDFEQELQKLGVLDMIEPAAVSTIKKLYGGAFNFLPFQFNIEGIFYNKAYFAENGFSEPKTWGELMRIADAFAAKGIQPFAASGEQGWPITRLISTYLYRSLGPNALQAVAEGTAKLTDPGYVKAAAVIADLGKKGYFGQNVTSLDYDSAQNEFLNGNAAMYYMGTWALTAVNNPEKNQIGLDNVGFMPFPAVEGGAGSIDQYPSNLGLPSTFGAENFSPKVADWLKCITENFGERSLVQENTISGFKVNGDIPPQPAMTQDIQQRIANSTESVLWFEALFNAKAGQDSSNNAPLLVTGQMAPEEFMQMLQTDLDAG